MKEETVTDEHAVVALAEAHHRYPRLTPLGARLVKVPLRGGATYIVRYTTEPPKDDPDAWEFQNAVVKGYRKLAGI